MSAFIDQLVTDLNSRIAAERAAARSKLDAIPLDMEHDLYRLKSEKIEAEFTLATYHMKMELLSIERSRRASTMPTPISPAKVSRYGIAATDNSPLEDYGSARDWKLS